MGVRGHCTGCEGQCNADGRAMLMGGQCHGLGEQHKGPESSAMGIGRMGWGGGGGSVTGREAV